MADIECFLKVNTPLAGIVSVIPDKPVCVNIARLQWRELYITGERRRWDMHYKSVLASPVLSIIYEFNKKLCKALFDHAKGEGDANSAVIDVDYADDKDFVMERSDCIALVRDASDELPLSFCNYDNCKTDFPARECACGRFHCSPSCALKDCNLVWCRNGSCKNVTPLNRTVDCTCFTRLCGHIAEDKSQSGKPCSMCDQPDYASRHCNCPEYNCQDCQKPMELTRFTTAQNIQQIQELERLHHEELAKLKLQLEKSENVKKVQGEFISDLRGEISSLQADLNALQQQVASKDILNLRLSAWVKNLMKEGKALLAENQLLQPVDTPNPAGLDLLLSVGGKRRHDGSEVWDGPRPSKQMRPVDYYLPDVPIRRTMEDDNIEILPTVAERPRSHSGAGASASNCVVDVTYAATPDGRVSATSENQATTYNRDRENSQNPQHSTNSSTIREMSEMGRSHLHLMMEGKDVNKIKVKEMLAIIYDPKYCTETRCSGIATLPYRPSKKPMLDYIYKHGDPNLPELAEQPMNSQNFRDGMFRILYRYLSDKREKKQWDKEKASEFASCLHTLWCRSDGEKHDHKAWNKIGIEVYWELVHTTAIVDIIINQCHDMRRAGEVAVDTLGIFGDRVLPCIIESMKLRYPSNSTYIMQVVRSRYQNCKDEFQLTYQKIKEKLESEPTTELLHNWVERADLTDILKLVGVRPNSTTIMAVVAGIADMRGKSTAAVDLYRDITLRYPSVHAS